MLRSRFDLETANASTESARGLRASVRRSCCFINRDRVCEADVRPAGISCGSKARYRETWRRSIVALSDDVVSALVYHRISPRLEIAWCLWRLSAWPSVCHFDKHSVITSLRGYSTGTFCKTLLSLSPPIPESPRRFDSRRGECVWSRVNDSASISISIELRR